MADVVTEKDEYGTWQVLGNTKVLIEPTQKWIDEYTVPATPDEPAKPTIEERLLEKDEQLEKMQNEMDKAILELTILIAMGGMPNV